jgi:long-chain acyl-CoA synthetase
MSKSWDQRLGVWWIADDHPDEPAILESPDGLRTYRELAEGAHQLVHLFRSLGAEGGDVVAAMLGNGVPLIEVSLACQEAGLLFIPLNPHLTASELATIMEHSATKVLVIEDTYAALADGLSGPKVLVTGGPFETARAGHPTTTPRDRSPGGLFVYTSGTTGKPKGIRRAVPVGDPDQVANDAAVFSRAFDFRPFEGPMLVSTGMFHGGSHSFYMSGLNAGQCLVIMRRFDAEEALRLIEEHRVRTGYMVPTQFSRFLALPEEVRQTYDVSSLHSIVHAAAPCPMAVKQRMMEWWGPVIWETYGGMEGAATIARPNRWLEKPGTVGRAVRGVSLAILDEDGNELPPGEIGQIYMQNDVGFTYHADDEGTAEAYLGARFSIGDLGYLDEDGYLFISGRSKDMIITGGTNVYPAEVEAALLDHPAVADVGVIGIPDPDWGESVRAVVQLSPGSEPSDELAAELIAFCRQRLASYKCPRNVEFRATLPRTEAGKLYKRQLVDESTATPKH